ncbi:MAG: nuclear transport factor 2 family protein [Calditrichaeota bacterium]|nr:nuclear transport factor 2 family protein [Calditrichota bacterium]RQW07393.1 MAG: nuclear transport factor 2 family protein [Calditrichota bacterium]
MITDAEDKSIGELIDIVKQINLSWREGHPEKLEKFFHENMMIVSADMKILGDGREACIRSYVDFINQVILHKYEESQPEVHVWGNTAIAWYDYEIGWEMNGKSHQESGKDLFVFSWQDGKWLAIWRRLTSA